MLVIFALGLLLGLVGFAFFYMEAESDLEAWLAGRLGQSEPTIFYAAPRRLRVGQRFTRDRLLEHLSRAGYVDVSKTEDSDRSRYRITRQGIEIWPGMPPRAASPSADRFPRLRVIFSRDGRSIQRLVDLETGEDLESALLEPEQIGSLARSVGASADSGRGMRLEVEYKQLPRHLIHAIVAIEDKRFFEHTGVDYVGILRALWHDLRAGEAVQGGSTITQQLVKNILVGSERTLRRKVREAFLALALERRLSKEEIFTRYVNVIYLGRRGGLSVYGVGAAAREYFDKDVSQLTLAESAFLAGIIHRPGYYITGSPRPEVLERGVRRRNVVLDRMVEQGFITKAEAERAKSAPLGLRFRAQRPGAEVSAPYFLDYVQEQVAELYPTTDLGQLSYRVYTTIDMDLQRAATAAMADGLERLDRDLARRHIPPGTVQGALVALHARTGEILAMIGGRNYLESQFNRAVDARRQPGSAIKPFVYAAALESGERDGHPLTLADMYVDEPRTFEGGYAPKNFGDTYLLRPVSVREALARSLNVITVQIAQQTGYATVARMIERCGLPRPPAHAATALGASEVTPLELAAAYSVFPNGGQRVTPLALRHILTADGHTLYETTPQRFGAMPAAVAYLVTSALRSVIAEPYGTGHAATALGVSALAGKTGTSQRSDAWFVGFTPQIICVVWVGFDDNRPLPLAASRAALPIWIAFMRQVATWRPDLIAGDFAAPEGIVEHVIDPQTGLRATDQCPEKRLEIFIQGREVIDRCSLHPGHPVEELPPEEVPPLSSPLPPPPTGAPHEPEAPRPIPEKARPIRIPSPSPP